MRPLELRLAGLRSWRSEQTLDLSDLGLVAIVGETGAGKSSLLEAIVYALYNASTFSGRDVRALISDGRQTMAVSLDFEADGRRWRVTRSTSRGSYPPATHRLVCLSDADEAPLERESAVTQRIEQLVGLDYRGFTSAVLLPQGRFQTLLTATEGDRSAILKGIFRLDELGRVREAADRLRRDLEPQLDALRGARAELLADPAGTAAAQARLLEALRATSERLRGLRDGVEAARREAVARAAEAERLGAAAGAVRRRRDAVPGLDDALAAEAELAAEESPLAAERERHAAVRGRARAALGDAAAAGEGIDAMAELVPRLREAAEQLPRLQLAMERIRGERAELGRRGGGLHAEAEAIAEARAELDSGRPARAELAAAADRAEGDHRTAAGALATARLRRHELAARHDALAAVEGRERGAQAAAAEARVVANAAGERLREARARFEDARRTDSAAAAAAGLSPGESCPVCSRELPEGFVPPAAAGLDAAHAALHEAERDHRAAERASAAAEATAEAARADAGRAREAVDDAERALRSARAALAATPLGEPDLAVPDDLLLAPLSEAARAARRAAGEAETAAARVAAELDARVIQLQGARADLQQAEARLTREGQEVDEAIARHRAALDALPPRLRPSGERPDQLAAAREAADGRLEELRAQRERHDAAARELERLDAASRALAERREARVMGPRRRAAAEATALRRLLEGLEPPTTSPEPPDEGAALGAHAAWIAGVLTAADAASSRLDARRGELAAAARAAEEEAGALLVEADRHDPEHPIADADGLRDALEDWGARERAAETLRGQAESQVAPARELDERIDTAERLRRAGDEVARLLADGKFVRWLVARRQRALLEVASDRFREVSHGRYGFAEDFQVVDLRTGQPRSAKTLSGGETFQASLALSLGMVELAARGGGRIDSFFLDEGFGSLDPNALDDALGALERRARAGQLIGVISHVAAVADRLQTVLRVSAGAEGSRVERLDPTARTAMLAAELAAAAA